MIDIIKIELDVNAPEITMNLKESLELLDDPDNFLLSIQLDYREDNIPICLNKVDCIDFGEDWLIIALKNQSKIFYNYINIMEYSIINSTELNNQGMINYA